MDKTRHAMVKDISFILEQLEEEFPDLTKGSISKICRRGTSRIRGLLREGEIINTYLPNRQRALFHFNETPSRASYRTQTNKQKRNGTKI